MTYDAIFDSSSTIYEKEFAIDSEKDTPLTVFFEKENIVLQADCQGNAVFMNPDGIELYRSKAESDRLFLKIYCKIKDNTVTVRFPVIEWVDHYPNCDGEYDRWSEIERDNILFTYPAR